MSEVFVVCVHRFPKLFYRCYVSSFSLRLLNVAHNPYEFIGFLTMLLRIPMNS